MNKTASLLSIALAFSIFVTSCNDDDDKSRTEYLTQHSWVIDKVEMKSAAGTSTIPLDSWQDACTQDNIITFTTDFKYKESPGADNCNGDETEETGTWAWKDGETKLALTLDGSTEEVKVDDLNDSRLRVSLGEESWDLDGDGIGDGAAEILISFKSK